MIMSHAVGVGQCIEDDACEDERYMERVDTYSIVVDLLKWTKRDNPTEFNLAEDETVIIIIYATPVIIGEKKENHL